jgi:hypothetical protein
MFLVGHPISYLIGKFVLSDNCQDSPTLTDIEALLYLHSPYSEDMFFMLKAKPFPGVLDFIPSLPISNARMLLHQSTHSVLYLPP